jgi:hypothetical protein
MMLHVRDCPGTTATFDICPFPWCRKVKHLMYHLVSCIKPEECDICSTEHRNTHMIRLRGLNRRRGENYQAALIAKAKAAADAVNAKTRAASKPRAAQTKAITAKPVQTRIAKKPALAAGVSPDKSDIVVRGQVNSAGATTLKMEGSPPAAQTKVVATKPGRARMAKKPALASEASRNDTVATSGTEGNSTNATVAKIEAAFSVAAAPPQLSATAVNATKSQPVSTVTATVASVALPSLSTASAEGSTQQSAVSPITALTTTSMSSERNTKLENSKAEIVGVSVLEHVVPASLVTIKLENNMTSTAAVTDAVTLESDEILVASVTDGHASAGAEFLSQSLAVNGNVSTSAALPLKDVAVGSNKNVDGEEKVKVNLSQPAAVG